mgnify:CR=1 FL=1
MSVSPFVIFVGFGKLIVTFFEKSSSKKSTVQTVDDGLLRIIAVSS